MDPIPLDPFTQADSLQLQRLQAGRSSADQALYDGEIDPDTHAQYQQEIGQRLAPLIQRQQAAKAQAMQEQKQMLMDEHATGTALDHQAAVFRARGLGDRITTYTDQITGRTAHLFEAKHGQIEELKFEGDPQSQETPEEGGEGGIDYSPLSGGTELGGVGDEKKNNRLTLINGPHQEIYEYPEGGTAKKVYDSQTGQSGPGQLSQAQLQEYWKRANRSISMPPGGHRDNAVTATFNHLVTSHLRREQHAQDLQTRAAEHVRQEGAREAEHTRQETAKKDAKQEEEDTLKQDRADYDTARKNLVARKGHDAPGPTHDEIESEARLVKGYRENRKNEREGKKAPAGNAVAAGQPVASQPAAVPETAHPALRGIPLTSTGAFDLGRMPSEKLDELDKALEDPKAIGVKPETAAKLREQVRQQKAARQQIGEVPHPAQTGSPNLWDRFKSGVGELPAAAGRVPGNVGRKLGITD